MPDSYLPNAPQPPSPLTPAEIVAYLDYAGEALIARRNAVIAALKAANTQYAAIADDDVLGEVSENVKMAAALGRTSEARRKEEKEPFKLGGETVDGWFKRFMTPLGDAMAPIQVKLDTYARVKLTREKAERERQLALAAAEAKRLAEIAAKALEKGKRANISAALDQAAEAAAQAELAANNAAQRPAAMTKSRGLFGSTASVRESWDWEITDFDAIPRAYLMVNADAVSAAKKARDASGKPSAVIPGLAWVSTLKMGIR